MLLSRKVNFVISVVEENNATINKHHILHTKYIEHSIYDGIVKAEMYLCICSLVSPPLQLNMLSKSVCVAESCTLPLHNTATSIKLLSKNQGRKWNCLNQHNKSICSPKNLESFTTANCNITKYMVHKYFCNSSETQVHACAFRIQSPTSSSSALYYIQPIC